MLLEKLIKYKCCTHILVGEGFETKIQETKCRKVLVLIPIIFFIEKLQHKPVTLIPLF